MQNDRWAVIKLFQKMIPKVKELTNNLFTLFGKSKIIFINPFLSLLVISPLLPNSILRESIISDKESS